MEKNEARELFRQLEECIRELDNYRRELESGAAEGITWKDFDEKQAEVKELKEKLEGAIDEKDRQVWLQEIKLEREAEARRDILIERIEQFRKWGAAAEKEGSLKESIDHYIKAFDLTYDRVVFWARTGSEAIVNGMSPDDCLAKRIMDTWKIRQDLLRDIQRVAKKIPEEDRKEYLRWLEKILSVPHDASVTNMVLSILGGIGDIETAELLLYRTVFGLMDHAQGSGYEPKTRINKSLKKSRIYVPAESEAEWWIAISKLWRRLKPDSLLNYLANIAQNSADKQDRTVAQAILDGKRLDIQSIHAMGRYLEIE